MAGRDFRTKKLPFILVAGSIVITPPSRSHSHDCFSLPFNRTHVATLCFVFCRSRNVLRHRPFCCQTNGHGSAAPRSAVAALRGVRVRVMLCMCRVSSPVLFAPLLPRHATHPIFPSHAMYVCASASLRGGAASVISHVGKGPESNRFLVLLHFRPATHCAAASG